MQPIPRTQNSRSDLDPADRSMIVVQYAIGVLAVIAAGLVGLLR